MEGFDAAEPLGEQKKATLLHNVRQIKASSMHISAVLSDTLGVTRARSGSLCVTKSTLDFPSVFALLARWLRCHQPASLSARFPWSSISMNYDFAAACHRDSHNTAASMTKSFGDFSGGRLLYLLTFHVVAEKRLFLPADAKL